MTKQLRALTSALILTSLFLTGCATHGQYDLVTVPHGDRYEAFRMNKATGQVWQFMPDRTWGKVPQPTQ